jgi:thiol-disulfide isomerase/thioredoxin
MPDKTKNNGMKTAGSEKKAGNGCSIAAHETYMPDPRILTQLGPALKGKAIVIFTGPGCSDCKEMMPKLTAILKAVNPKPDVKVFDLEHGSIAPPEMKRLSILAIPTLIILNGGRELGRIVERPIGSWEENILRICVG